MCAGPNGLDSVPYRTGMISWRYFVVWMPSSGRRVCSWFTKRVESRGYGNDANEDVKVVFVELIWWNEGIMWSRRMLVRPVMYVLLLSGSLSVGTVGSWQVVCITDRRAG